MRLTEKLSHLRFAVLLGGAAGFVAGCVIVPASTECGSTFSNSEMVGEDCFCEDGYDWCNDDADDFTCCEYEEACVSGSNNHVDNADNCECDPGYTWCDPEDEESLDCCPNTSEDSGTDSTSGDGDGDSGTGDGDGDGDTGTGDGVLPPDECEPEQEGSFWCTHTDAMGPIGSQTFECMEGFWVENAGWPELDCTSSDYDFGVGCVFNEKLAEYQSVCGYGPGDACDQDEYTANCGDSDLLLDCFYTKVQATSCQDFCENIGVGGETFEMGVCEEVEGVSDCTCSDAP